MSRLRKFFFGFRNTSQDLKTWGISKIHFLKSEWEELDEPEISWLYLTWRGFYALFCVFAVAFSLYISPHRHLWLIFLTHWSLTCQLIYSLLFFITLINHTVEGNNDIFRYANKELNSPAPSKDFKDMELTISGHIADNFEKLSKKNNKLIETVLWVLTGIVGTLPIFVTLCYWSVIYPTEETMSRTDLWGTILVHGINAIVALVDILIIAVPVRVTHFIFLMTFAITYAIFSRLYELAGGPYAYEPEKPYIYEVLNWRQDPQGASVTCALTIPVVIVLYYFLWFLYILRLRLVFTCSSRRDRKSCHSLHQYWLHYKLKTVNY